MSWDRIGETWVYRRTEKDWGFRLERRLARLCLSVAQWIWRHESGACHRCGQLVGLRSSISQDGLLCPECLDWVREKRTWSRLMEIR